MAIKLKKKRFINRISSTLKPWLGKGDQDVLRLTQRKLTLQYSAVLISFLILFILTVYGLLYFLLIHQQKQQLESWIEQQIYSQREGGKERGEMGGRMPSYFGMRFGTMAGGTNDILGYYSGADGDLVPLTEDRTGLSDLLESDLSGKAERSLGSDGETRYWTISNGEEWLLVAGRTLTEQGQKAGTFYAAKETTSQHRLFQWLLAVLVGIALLFCGVAVYLSYKMSSKAMVPVKRSFTRQQEFVADASHELRTPLSVLLSSIDVLEMEGAGESSPFSRKVLDNMRDEAKRMIRLSESLLTLARSDSGAVELKLEAFAVTELAERIIASLQPVAASKAIALSLHADVPISIRGDRERISQLLVILLDNALKYTPEGGHVDLRLFLTEPKSQKLVMEVSDDGIGIKAEEQGRIFERFYREEKSRARELGGHGLGLSIAKWIVEAHNGTIGVTSAPEQGSTFRVELPVSG